MPVPDRLKDGLPVKDGIGGGGIFLNDHPGGGFDFSGIGSILQPDKSAEEAVIPVGGRNSDPAVLLLRIEVLNAIEMKAAVTGEVLHYCGYLCVVGMEHPDGLA